MDEIRMDEVMNEEVGKTVVEAIETVATQPAGKSKLGLAIGIAAGVVTTAVGCGITLVANYRKKHRAEIDEKQAEKLRKKGYRVEKVETEVLEADSVSDAPKK